MSQELVTTGDGSIETETVYQIGFEPGADNFVLMVEDVKMPTRKVLLFQEKNSSLITSFWTGEYNVTSLVLSNESDTFVSVNARGVQFDHAIDKDTVTYDSGTLVAIEFEFDELFTVSEITSYALNRARTEWGETLLITSNAPEIILPPARAAVSSMPLKANLTRNQTGLMDFKATNVSEGVGLVSWINGFELMFGTNGTVDFYGPTSVTTGPDKSVSRYVFTDGGNDAVDALLREGG